jgi:hypothetical protein
MCDLACCRGVEGASATSPAAGGVRGVPPRHFPATFTCRRASFVPASLARWPQGGFGGSPPDSPRFCPLPPRESACFALASLVAPLPSACPLPPEKSRWVAGGGRGLRAHTNPSQLPRAHRGILLPGLAEAQKTKEHAGVGHGTDDQVSVQANANRGGGSGYPPPTAPRLPASPPARPLTFSPQVLLP